MTKDDRVITVAEIDTALAKVRARDRDIFMTQLSREIERRRRR